MKAQDKKNIAIGGAILGAAILFKFVVFPKLKDLFKAPETAALPSTTNTTTATNYTAPTGTTTTGTATTGTTETPAVIHAQVFQAKDAIIGEILYSGGSNGVDTYEKIGDYSSFYTNYEYGDYIGKVVSKSNNWVKVYHEAQTWLFGASGYLYIEGIALVSTEENL